MLMSRPAALAILVALVGIALVIPGRAAFFLLPPLALLPRFIAHVRAGRVGAAARDSLLWALALSILTIACVALFPEHAATRIARGVEYRDEMFHWIATGVGKEGEIRQFLPEHLAHLAFLLVLSFATGGIAALYLGGFLLGYMNFYVGSLIAAANAPVLAAAVGWPIWSVCRVAGFVLAAIAVARPFYSRFRTPRPPPGPRPPPPHDRPRPRRRRHPPKVPTRRHLARPPSPLPPRLIQGRGAICRREAKGASSTKRVSGSDWTRHPSPPAGKPCHAPQD